MSMIESALESGLGLEPTKDESTKQTRYTVRNRSRIQNIALGVVIALICLAALAISLYGSRMFLREELSLTKEALSDKDFHEDLRTVQLIVEFGSHLSETLDMGERTDIFLDMEKAAENDLENDIVKLINSGQSNGTSDAKTTKRDVRRLVMRFEERVDSLVEDTIGKMDDIRSGARQISKEVLRKLSDALDRVVKNTAADEQHQEAREKSVANTLGKVLNCFFNNVVEFDKQHVKEVVPRAIFKQLIKLAEQDEMPVLKKEARLFAILPNPEVHGLKPYAGKMQKAHRVEEYIKRMLIVRKFQKRKTVIVDLMNDWNSKKVKSAQALKVLVQHLGRTVPMSWMTNCQAAKHDEWSYGLWGN